MCVYVGVRQTWKYEQHIVQCTDFSINLTSERKKRNCSTKGNEVSIFSANYIGMKNYHTRSDPVFETYNAYQQQHHGTCFGRLAYSVWNQFSPLDKINFPGELFVGITKVFFKSINKRVKLILLLFTLKKINCSLLE